LKKNDFVKLVAENGNLAIKTAGDAINATFEEIASALEKGDSISLISHR
jgi:nucleoid DNA-binding protein